MDATYLDEPRIMYVSEEVNFGLRREHTSVEVVARFTIDGEPESKSRARFSTHGGKVNTYTPAATKRAQERVAWHFRSAVKGWTVDGKSAFGLAAVFFADTKQRRDVDNMIKLICDGLNKVAWEDDSQVHELSGRKGFDQPGNARTEVLIYRMGPIVRAQRACAHCGTQFDMYDSTPNRKHCSQGCRIEAKRGIRERICQNCGEAFDTGEIARKAKYCSVQCKSDHLTVTRPCQGCGAEVRRPKSWTKRETWCSSECRVEHKTHCNSGHEYTPENTYWHKDSNRRECRTCRRDRDRERRAAGKK